MSYLINNQQKVNDIIFAGRNKNYGAYAIRSSYGNTLLKSIIVMITGFGSLLLAAWYVCNKNEEVILYGQTPPDVIYKTVPFNNTPEEKKPGKAAAASPLKETKKQPQQSSLVIADSTSQVNETKEPVITTAPGVQIASQNNEGTGTATAAISGDNGNSQNTKKGDGNVSELYGVDSQPEFEGGMTALYKFISNNMRYPAEAAEIGQGGTVFVRFVVDENGKVGHLTLLNKSGYGFDEEAMRVVSMIPNFKTPAKVSGRAVKVYYQIPIKFRSR